MANANHAAKEMKQLYRIKVTSSNAISCFGLFQKKRFTEGKNISCRSVNTRKSGNGNNAGLDSYEYGFGSIADLEFRRDVVHVVPHRELAKL